MNIVLAVKEYFRQGNHSKLDKSLAYGFPVWTMDYWQINGMFEISVYFDGEWIYEILVASSDFVDAGKAFVISVRGYGSNPKWE